MIFDAEDGDDSWFRDQSFDVCVVGSGPAGITLSRALAKNGVSVGLFEGGGLDASPESQSLYAGEVVGMNYWPLDTSRLRFFGGTSNHWMGMCRPLDKSDFYPRAGNPNSGWPIKKTDLAPYAVEADHILDIQPAALAPNPFKVSIFPLKPILFRFSPPTRFKRKYAEELAQSTRIRMYYNANLVGIVPDDARCKIREFRFQSYKRDQRFAVKATHFVLCLGGLENPRVLLNTGLGDHYAIGNQYDLVGRNFCEHLHFTLGQAVMKHAVPEVSFFSPKEQLMKRADILNFGLRLHASPARPESYLRDFACSTPVTRALAEKISASLDCNPPATLRVAAEQALNPESRVRLTDKVDRFGLRRIALDWRLSEVDTRTLRVAGIQCGYVFAKRDIGRVKLRDWVLDQIAGLPSYPADEALGNHHLCTTRMSSDPRLGVVDANCRVHEIENLYLGGSSVFATGGHCNPTYTIVQLALRLADHLSARIG